MRTKIFAKPSSLAVALGALLMLAMLLSPLMTPGSSLADRITVSVRLNGGSAWTPPSPSSSGGAVSGPTGVTIQVEFTLGVTESTWWRGTSYQFEGGETVCVNHADATTNGQHTRTFNIVAPANAGQYDLTLTARADDACSSGTSAPFKMLNAVTVAESPNPDLTAACGIRVVLVLDESGSIQEEGAIGSVRQAANAFIESLADTGSEVAVVEFNTHARTPIPFTPVTAGPTGTIATLFRPYVNDTSGGEGYNPGDYPYGNGLRTTNWDDAFEKVQTLNQGARARPAGRLRHRRRSDLLQPGQAGGPAATQSRGAPRHRRQRTHHRLAHAGAGGGSRQPGARSGDPRARCRCGQRLHVCRQREPAQTDHRAAKIHRRHTGSEDH